MSHASTRSAADDAVFVVGNNIVDQVLFVDDLKLDQKVFCDEWQRYGGGQAANVAATLAHLGVSARFLGRFGGDEAGAFTRSVLEGIGVDTRPSPTLNGRTMSAVVAVDRSRGERTIIMLRDAGLQSQALPVSEDILDGIGLLYTDGYERETFEALALVARRRALPVMADLEQVGPRDHMLFALVTHLIAPAAILRRLAGTDDTPSALTSLHAAGPQVVVATLGADGAMGTDGGPVVTVPAQACPVLDTTGAGDAFHAGYIAAMRAGQDLHGCLAFATRVAAAKCGRPGPRAEPRDLQADWLAKTA